MPNAAYDWEHRKRRARLLPKAWGKACPLCGFVMLEEQALDLDHSVPLALGGTVGDRIVHAFCNRSAGGKLARRRQGRRVKGRRTQAPGRQARRGSQDW